MKLPSAFIKLPLQFDAERLALEAAQFTERDWVDHPTGFTGNAAVRLISANGGDNDAMGGPMRATPQLAQCPYIQQVLASFESVFGRSRLMGLGPKSEVPAHNDLNHHWHYRVRIHVPIFTWPEVRFHCGDQSVHMAPGEAWIFDNWRRHWVVNPTEHFRIHLVADTSGSPAFWRMVARGGDPLRLNVQTGVPEFIGYQPGVIPLLLTENHNMAQVMPPGELDALVNDLVDDVRRSRSNDAAALTVFCDAARMFACAWRENWYLHADHTDGWPRYQALRREMARIAQGNLLRLGSNAAPLGSSMMGRVVLPALDLPLEMVNVAAAGNPSLSLIETEVATKSLGAVAAPLQKRSATTSQLRKTTPAFDRPLIILTAPRSGSTLLFETLAQSAALYTIGGESHGIIEALPELNPATGRIDSNRLTAADARDDMIEPLHAAFAQYLRDRNGHRPAARDAVRLLEKTPKNALRIPFLEKLFPDARYLFLYRDPREAIASVMEAWRNGGWITYPALPGWFGPWSFLLPPGWQQMQGKSLADIAAFQWVAANDYILQDLPSIEPTRWMAMGYAEFLADSTKWASRICAFAEIEFDAGLRARCARPLPHSRLTLTPPRAEKWRKNEVEINPLSEKFMPQWAAIRAFAAAQEQRNPWPPYTSTNADEADSTTTLASRNHPCPCGSGLRYKNCHGKLT